MDGTENEHIVKFDKYCEKCKSKELSESEDPCWDCLSAGVTLNGVPTYFREATHAEKN